jgi:hypothetical protein
MAVMAEDLVQVYLIKQVAEVEVILPLELQLLLLQ